MSFGEDSSSYRTTGVPRGNPKRFQSHGVLRVSGEESRHCQNPRRVNIMSEVIETEGEKQLKKLAKRQLDTNVTLQGELKRRKDFTEAAVYKPLVKELSGTTTLQEYEKLQQKDSQLDHLRHCGFTDYEISTRLNNDRIFSSLQKADMGNTRGGNVSAEPSAERERQREMERKVNTRDERVNTHTASSKQVLSRQEMDLQNAICHTEQDKLLLNMLTTTKVSRLEDPHDPINQLDQIMDDIMEGKTAKNKNIHNLQGKKSHTNQPKISCTIRQIRKSNAVESNSASLSSIKQINSSSLHTKPGKFINAGISDIPDSDVYGTFKSSAFSVSNCGKIEFEDDELPKDIPTCVKKPPDAPSAIPIDIITRYKLSLDEIKLIPRFKDYTPGQPSKTLFVKNLSNKITESDLASLFLNFEQPGAPKITYRLLNGRMKGQAFVTFNDEKTAMRALEVANGYPLKDRPIIIVYGKSKQSQLSHVKK